MVRFSTRRSDAASHSPSKRHKRLASSPTSSNASAFSSPLCFSDAVDVDCDIFSRRGHADQEQSSSEWGGDSTPAFFDLETLDCNVCMEPLCAPIYQCCNGHYSCLDCTTKMSNKCPTCSEPSGKIRNLGLEKILDSLRLRCRYFDHGCPNLLAYKDKKIHEMDCLFTPCFCPVQSCEFHVAVNDLVLHCQESHNVQTLLFHYDTWFTVSLPSNDNYMLLKSKDRFFLFCCVDETVGKLIYISAFGSSSLEENFTYHMELKVGVKRHLALSSTIQKHDYSQTNLDCIDFLVVPKCLMASKGSLQVEVTINCPIRSLETAKK